MDDHTFSKTRDILFFLMVFSLPFLLIPPPLQRRFLGGPVWNKLIFYPLFIGMILTLWRQYKYRKVFIEGDRFKKFILIYAGIIFLSLLHGLYVYPYYDLIVNGPVDQIEKLPKVLALLDTFGIAVNSKLLTAFWMIIRTIKIFLLEIIYTFGCSYLIFCWYSNDWQRCFRIFMKAIVASLILVLAYSCIDAGYLAGSGICQNILVLCNPYIHVIRENGTWWPPMLWPGQIRSLFAEPSYFGMYATLVLPFLWYYLLKNNKNFVVWLLTFMLMFFVILTKSRTAVLLMWGELGLLFVGVLLQRNKKFCQHFLLICGMGLLAFLGGIYFTIFAAGKSNAAIGVVQPQTKITTGAANYVNNNVASVVSKNRGSNRSRYAIIAANLSIGKQHPLLGVGTSLRPAYIADNLPSWGYNDEVNMWLKNQKEEGILKSGIPNLCEFAVRFSETGMVGLGLFLFPFFYLLKMLHKSYKTTKYHKEAILFFTISLLASTAVGFGDGLNILFAYWVLLGVGYTMCYGLIKAAE